MARMAASDRVAKQIYLESADGSIFKLTVSNTGTPQTEAVARTTDETNKVTYER